MIKNFKYDNPNIKISKSECIDDIINYNINELSTLDILHYQSSISYFIQILIQETLLNKASNTNNIYDKLMNIINYLEWISVSSKKLSNDINQEIKSQVYTINHLISRSSYNFCSDNYKCKLFYTNNNSSCSKHHYVHSLLNYDVESVIHFLKYIIENNLSLSETDTYNLYMSIKTICFVCRHMLKEMMYIDYLTENKSNEYHKNNIFQKKNSFYKIKKTNIPIKSKSTNLISYNNRYSALFNKS